ncbi:site-2 protease family protein [Brevundimonas sp.]|uniref:metalloprotease n=1 Tax=Brevundimonas sp. TaxID=1871086 RepID=UPI0017C26079|nr:site-2 protease family protein [Brevundimonas sp.]MBA3050406.1 peptidase M50 [Brevundimonas sp.]
MTDSNTPRPGPWDAKPGPTAAPPPRTAAPSNPRAVQETLDKGQHPLWALVSTLLLGGLIWWFTGSWIAVVAILFGLLVHEYGHVLAMNAYGMGPARIYVVPFVGGMAKAQRLAESEWHGVLVSLAGPAFGLLAAIPFFGLYIVTGQGMWLEGVFYIAILNLLNLAPAPPLDGSKALGPVLALIHPMVEKVAMILVGGGVVAWGISNGSYIFAAFLGFALYGHLRRGHWRPEGRRLTPAEAGRSVGLFALTAAACFGVALSGLMPLAGSLDQALAIGTSYFEFGG